MNKLSSFTTGLLALCGLLLATIPDFANIPGGGTGTGADVTLTDNGSTATMANGIVSILITKANANITQINYTYNNGGGTQTQQLLNGGFIGRAPVSVPEISPIRSWPTTAITARWICWPRQPPTVSWTFISPCCAVRRVFT
jgi:hypothetical protein